MKKSKIISTKGLTKKLINKYSIINGAKSKSICLQDGLQNYLVFISARHIYWITKHSRDSQIELRISTGMSEESITNPNTSYISFAPKIVCLSFIKI